MRRLPAAALAAILFSLACGESEDDVLLPRKLLPPEEKDTSFVTVRGGTFVTPEGDTVQVAGFRLGRYEVTNRLYLNLAAEENIPLPPDPGFPGMEDYLYKYPDYPVVNVSMNEAEKAAAILGGRLPTITEWRYAASLCLDGDVVGRYPWGELTPELAGYPANYLAGDQWETRYMDGYLWTAPVDSFPLTDAGFACQAGNVAEWTVIPGDSMAGVCGGAWLSAACGITVDACRRLSPGDRARHVGFRILLPLNR